MNTNIIEEMVARRAFRDLEKRSVPPETVERILKAGMLAPSCFNNQPWRFLVLTEEPALEKGFSVLTRGNAWARESSFLIAAVTRDDLDCELSDDRHYALFDTGLAVQNLILQAQREGMVGHPMAGYDPAALKSLFSIPADYRVIALIAFGYLKPGFSPDQAPPRERKPLSETAFFNAWPEEQAARD